MEKTLEKTSSSEEKTAKAIFFVVRTSAGQELNAVRLLAARANTMGAKIRSILFIPKFKGYLFVEADREYEVRRLVRGSSKVKLMSASPISMNEIEDLLSSEAATIEIEKGDIVKIVKGNFKGYRAKVLSVLEGGKGMILARLLDIDRDWEVKIPLDHVKLEKKGEEVKESG